MKKLISLVFLFSASAMASDEIMADIWITKDALKSGIKHEQAELVAGGRAAVVGDKYYKSWEFSLTEKQAKYKAEVMRRREIDKLNARIEELNALKFDE